MSYPGGNPNFGFGQAPSPYPPAPGGSPYPPTGGMYPPAPGGSPYPPAAGSSPYPSAPGSSPYPSAPGSSPYPSAPGSSPYPPAPGSSPYPQAPGGSPYPPQGGSSYPPQGGSTYPPQGASPYPPSTGASPYPPASGASPYPPASGVSPYPPTSGSSPYPPASAGSHYPPAPGSSPYPMNPPGMGGNPYGPTGGYPSAGGAPHQPSAQSYMPQSNTSYPGAGAYAAAPQGYPGVGTQSQTAGYHSGGSLLPYRETPTVKPQPHFDASSDAAVLRKAMKGFGTDEAAIINVLARRTSHERQQIMLKYQQAYGRDLIKDLKSELSGKFEDVVVALMTPLPVYLARELHEAMAGFGTNERTLVEILCTRDNASLMMIKNAYYQEYRRKMEDDLRGDTSGDFRRLLISMCACSRDEMNCDPALANSLAQQLYKAGEGKMGTDEGEFNRILASYSYPLLRCVFVEYKKIRGKTFGDAIKAELSGDLRLGMESVYQSIENRAGFFARALHESMAGMGTKDRALIRLVVSRSEIDMVNIKDEYKKIYGKPLDRDIKGDTSGDYKKILLTLIGV